MNLKCFLMLNYIILSHLTMGQDSTFYRHIFGLNANEFVLIFEHQDNLFDLNYRFNLNDRYSLRSGLNYDQETGDDGELNMSVRIGADFSFKTFTKWVFYAGPDVSYGIIHYSSDNRRIRKTGGIIFLGIMYKIGKHFSLATEPDIGFFYNKSVDPSAFGEKSTTWSNIKIGKIGQILINFHF